MTDSTQKYFYRYECYFGEAIQNIFTKEIEYLDYNFICLQLPMISETPKGYWLCKHELSKPISEYNVKELEKKWIPKDSKKRYAYPTKQQALTNFIKRKQKSLDYLQQSLDKTTQMVKIALAYQETDKNI